MVLFLETIFPKVLWQKMRGSEHDTNGRQERDRTQWLIRGPRAEKVPQIFWSPKFPENVCGSLFCILSPEMRNIIPSGGPNGAVWMGGKKICRKSLCALSVLTLVVPKVVVVGVPDIVLYDVCGWTAVKRKTGLVSACCPPLGFTSVTFIGLCLLLDSLVTLSSLWEESTAFCFHLTVVLFILMATTIPFEDFQYVVLCIGTTDDEGLQGQRAFAKAKANLLPRCLLWRKRFLLTPSQINLVPRLCNLSLRLLLQITLHLCQTGPKGSPPSDPVGSLPSSDSAHKSGEIKESVPVDAMEPDFGDEPPEGRGSSWGHFFCRSCVSVPPPLPARDKLCDKLSTHCPLSAFIGYSMSVHGHIHHSALTLSIYIYIYVIGRLPEFEPVLFFVLGS